MKPSVFLLAAFSLHAQVVTSQLMLPLKATVSITSGSFQDLVNLSGSLQLVTQAQPSDPCRTAIPTDPCRAISTLINVSGTSLMTGNSYRATGTSTFTGPITQPGGITFTGSYRLTPPNPITPPSPIRQFSFSLPLSLSLNSSGQIASAAVKTGGVLWQGNDSDNPEDRVAATDTSGNLLESVAAAVTGIAFDGTNLWFSDPFGKLTKRTSDGNTVLVSFPGGAVASTEDMAWDSRRQRLWRVVNYAPVLQRIDPATGTIEASYPLPAGDANDPLLYPRAAIGLAYDSARDRLYVSFCRVGCSTFGGAVGAFDPAAGTFLGDLFRIPNFLPGGLAFDAATGTLWAQLWDGQQPVLTNMRLDGATISSFARPGARFVDGLEFIGASSIP